MKKSSEIFVTNLEAEMKRLDLDYKGLAEKTGRTQSGKPAITRSGIYKIANGQRSPNTDNLDRIAKALGRTVAWLFTDHSQPENQPTPAEALEVLKRAISAPKPSEPEIPADVLEMVSRCPKDKLDQLKATLRGLLPPEPPRPVTAKPREKSK